MRSLVCPCVVYHTDRRRVGEVSVKHCLQVVCLFKWFLSLNEAFLEVKHHDFWPCWRWQWRLTRCVCVVWFIRGGQRGEGGKFEPRFSLVMPQLSESLSAHCPLRPLRSATLTFPLFLGKTNLVANQRKHVHISFASSFTFKHNLVFCKYFNSQ